MKTKLISAFLLTAGFFVLGANAQNAAPSAPANEASSPTPSRFIYSPRLPSATELTNVAAAQGLSVERIDQTDAQIIVTYKAGNGQLSTVAYQLLPNAGAVAPSNNTVATPATPAPSVVYSTTQTAPAPTVIYTSAAQPYPYYFADDPYYYPWGGYYSPVSVGLGFGFYRGFGYRGGFHGGYRGGWHGHGHR